MAQTAHDVDSYIASFPTDVQAALIELRRTVHAVVPDADETISYQIPTLTLNGRRLVHFAGWKRHVSLYPAPAATGSIAADLDRYRAGRGTLRFPLSQPLPVDLIREVVRLLVAQRADGADSA